MNNHGLMDYANSMFTFLPFFPPDFCMYRHAKKTNLQNWYAVYGKPSDSDVWATVDLGVYHTAGTECVHREWDMGVALVSHWE